MIYETKFGCFKLSGMEAFSQWLAEHDKQIRAEVVEEFCEGYKNFQTDENICDLQEYCSVSGGRCIDCYKEHWLKEQNNEKH